MSLEEPEPQTEDRPEVSESAVRVGPQPKRRKWLALFCLLFLLLAILFAYLWWHCKYDQTHSAKTDNTAVSTNNTSKGTTKPPAPSCVSGTKAYENHDLEVAFCYPTAWGSPALHDAKFSPSDSGSRWLISFAGKPAVNVGLVSNDWATGAARDGVCRDPAQLPTPDFGAFALSWKTEGSGSDISSVSRGIEMAPSKYLIEEYADNVLTGGACMKGYAIFSGTTYKQLVASYSAEFSGSIPSPKAHMDEPLVLIPATDRSDFATLIKSVRKF